MRHYYPVLLETSSNQPFIFATNKLRENVGASQLIHESGTRLVLQVIEELGGPDLWNEDLSQVRDAISDPDRNPPIETRLQRIEVVVATSGKALMVVDDAELGREIVRNVTMRARMVLPGIDLLGVVGSNFAFGDLGAIHQSIVEVHRTREQIAYVTPGQDSRFLRLPFIAPCDTSGRPASVVELTRECQPVSKGSEILLGATTFAKRRAFPAGRSRMSSRFPGIALMDPNVLQESLDESRSAAWAAVIHADGNGIGRIFRNFIEYLDQGDQGTCRDYLNQLRCFSSGLEACGEAALRAALLELGRSCGDEGIPVVPLVAGGDDLTVYCAGRLALGFVVNYLRAFELETAEGAVGSVARRAFPGIGHLTACAGIAIVKPHFPFHAAYDLADDLVASAKNVKRRVHDSSGAAVPCSALDFHILYDIADAKLGRIRSRMRVDPIREDGEVRSTTWLFGHPYILVPQGLLDRPSEREPQARVGGEASSDWVRLHDWEKLREEAAIIRTATSGRESRALSNAVLHALRESLFLGHAEADAHLKLLIKRYPILRRLTRIPEDETLFWPDKDDDDRPIRRTSLLDAVEVAQFMDVGQLAPRTDRAHSPGRPSS